MTGTAKILGVQPSEGERASMKIAISLYSGEPPNTLPTGTVFTFTQIFDGITYEYPFQTIEDEIIYATQPGLTATSTTSLAIAIASKTFTTQSGLGWVAGMRVRATSAANSANYMEGTITSYSTTTLVLDIDTIGGSGTLADWDLLTVPNIITVYSQKVGLHPTPEESQEVTVLTVNSSIETVLVATTAQSSPDAYFYAGSNPEEDSTYLSRCTTALRSLSGAITTASQLRAYILTNYTNVSKCKVYDLMQDTTRLLDAGGSQTQTDTEIGHVFVTVYGIERLLTAPEKTAIYDDVIAKCVAGIVVEIEDPDVLEIAGLTISFSFDSQYDEAEIESLVGDTVMQYLSPYGFDSTKEAVFIGNISSIVNNIEGVEFCEGLLFDYTGLSNSTQYFEDANYNMWFRKAGSLPSLQAITATGTPI